MKGPAWKYYMVFIVALVAGLAIIFGIFKIQVIEGSHWKNKAAALTTKYRKIKAVRGNIYSADGNLLATSIPVYNVRMDVNADALTDDVFYAKIDSLAYCLSNYFKDKSQRAYKNMLVSARKRGERYLLVKSNIGYLAQQKVKTFPLFRKGRYKGGLIFEKFTRRKKPFGILAERTIGYEMENVHPVGLEGAYSDVLAGTEGMRLERRLSGGVWMPVGDENQIDPKDGMDIITTIDVNIQDVAEKALLDQLRKHDADHGCVVLMEVKTGNVVAIANLARSSTGAYSESYNYAVGESTEPGSTMKLAALMAALDDGHISIDDTVDAGNGVHYYYNVPMHDTKDGGHGEISVKRAFEVSSNIGVSKIISKHYSKNPQAFVDKLYSFRLNEPLGLKIAGEGRPKIQHPSDKAWSGISLTQMSIGYEMLMTPMQILAFYNAVANNGVLLRPNFVKHYAKNGKIVKTLKPEILNPAICNRKTIEQLKVMLEGVVEEGTGANLKNAHFKIAGKTGTARIANASYGYKYTSKYSYQASFCGYFPADNPMYSCIVVVNAPSNAVYYGNLVAGPIFREIADKVFASQIEHHSPLNAEDQLLAGNVPVSLSGYYNDLVTVFNEFNVRTVNKGTAGPWARTSTKDSEVEILPYESEKYPKLVPNVVGMGLMDAIYLLENRGLQVVVSGRGMVKKQSIPPGRRIRANETIKIDLS
ncbi:penicillin-binding protein [Luteibaculum oceani]|uniref:PASTA domain-containing protein n=1 Tax=Luteibaculum oceani TaxID=1294296 RepID=A0A5C6V116_9FLAO|nr:penicillin-binding protein [Luteibaculum oceani]TXC78879.1 PASTA domain-containing protein [Luteibaculum oceani]